MTKSFCAGWRRARTPSPSAWGAAFPRGYTTFLLSEYRGTLVIDADALTALAEYGADILREKSCRVILTPHAKEFSRLCGKPLEEVLQNGGALARAFAAEYGVTVLLKGHTSLVTNGKFTIFCNEGTPALAKGGSGDVLSGVIVGQAGGGGAGQRVQRLRNGRHRKTPRGDLAADRGERQGKLR